MISVECQYIFKENCQVIRREIHFGVYTLIQMLKIFPRLLFRLLDYRKKNSSSNFKRYYLICFSYLLPSCVIDQCFFFVILIQLLLACVQVFSECLLLFDFVCLCVFYHFIPTLCLFYCAFATNSRLNRRSLAQLSFFIQTKKQLFYIFFKFISIISDYSLLLKKFFVHLYLSIFCLVAHGTSNGQINQ